jgi:hypothetical protein
MGVVTNKHCIAFHFTSGVSVGSPMTGVTVPNGVQKLTMDITQVATVEGLV